MILLTFYDIVSGDALMQEDCDIIGLLCNCVRSGLCRKVVVLWPFM